MVFLFRKLTTFLKKLFQTSDTVESKTNTTILNKELIEKISLQEKNLADKERKLNESRLKLKEYFTQFKEYRDRLIISLKKIEDEKKTLNEEIRSLKNQLTEINLLKNQIETNFSTLSKKHEQKETELIEKEKLIESLLESSKNSEQLLHTDSIQIDELKRIARELYFEKSRLEKILRAKEEMENQSQKIIYSDEPDLNDFGKDTPELISTAQAKIDIYTVPETDLSLINGVDTVDIIEPTMDENTERQEVNVDDGINAIIEEITKVLEDNHESVSGMIQQDSRTIPPEKRSGRIRIAEPIESLVDGTDRERKFKPRVVCWKEERIWRLSIELPIQVTNDSEVTVLQNNIPLELEVNKEGYYNLRSLKGKIRVSSSNHNFSDLDIGDDGYLVFKLSAGNLREGILVKHTSNGIYLAVVPSDWQYDESLSGPQMARAEQTSLRGYLAYFYSFIKNDERKIGFKNLNNDLLSVDTLKQFYKLEGNLIESYASRQGPLFGENLPIINVTDINIWNKIQCIIVGEEGEDRDSWRERIEIKSTITNINLSDYLTNILSGWYFVRFYDLDNQLVDSTDFRFVNSLLKIEYNSLDFIPGNEGFEDLEVLLFHTSDFKIQHNDFNATGIDVSRIGDNKTKIVIKSNYWEDRIEFDTYSENGRLVQLFLPINRIWWSVDQGDLPMLWEDKIITLTRDDFLTLNKSIFIKYPQSVSPTSIKFGFQNNELRRFPIRSDTNYVRISLIEFSDSEIQMERIGSYPLECEIVYNEHKIKFIPFKVVVNAKCKFCNEFKSFNKTEIINHIIEAHLSSVYAEPSYDDIQPLLPDFPKKIYKCIYCSDENPTYVKAYSNNPVEEILRHIDHEHTGKARRFRIEDEISEIEKIMSVEIPKYKICKFCKILIPESDLARHLSLGIHERDIMVR